MRSVLTWMLADRKPGRCCIIRSRRSACGEVGRTSGSTVKTLISVAYWLCFSMVVIVISLSGSLHLDSSTHVRFLHGERDTEDAVGYLVKRVQQSLRRRMRCGAAPDGSVDGAVRCAPRAGRPSRMRRHPSWRGCASSPGSRCRIC